MIAKLTGEILQIKKDSIVLETGKIAFEIFVPSKDLLKLSAKETISIWTHMDVSENSIRLFGFIDYTEQVMFEHLISISGIGPKIALKIIDQVRPDEIKSAVQNSTPEIFKNVSGIGTKNAGRIIIELQNKLGDPNELNLSRLTQNKKQHQDLISAVTSLGFTKSEIDSVLPDLNPDLSTQEKIKEILKMLGS